MHCVFSWMKFEWSALLKKDSSLCVIDELISPIEKGSNYTPKVSSWLPVLDIYSFWHFALIKPVVIEGRAWFIETYFSHWFCITFLLHSFIHVFSPLMQPSILQAQLCRSDWRHRCSCFSVSLLMSLTLLEADSEITCQLWIGNPPLPLIVTPILQELFGSTFSTYFFSFLIIASLNKSLHC